MRVGAVIVTYRPGEETAAGLAAIAPQVQRVIVADNGSPAEKIDWLRARLDEHGELLELRTNRGVGAGHNAGIARARELNLTHVLLLDQDSVPAPDMVARLLDAEEKLLARGERVGAVGPVFHDARLGKSWPFYRLSTLGIRPQHCDGEDAVRCDFLISSGTLVRLEVLAEIGGMREDYFLEHVDNEWALRARQKGYALFGVCAARMEHALGDAAVRVPVTGQRVQLYQPYRHYYLFRNAVLLGRASYTPLAWKLNEIRRLALRLVFFSLFVAPRGARLRYMLLGLWHGLRGRAGRLAP